MHRVLVLPNSSYFNNQLYLKLEEELVFEFIEKFPSQNISFITDNSFVGLNHVDFEKAGANYCMPDVTMRTDKITESILKYTASTLMTNVQIELFAGFRPTNYQSPDVEILDNNIDSEKPGSWVELHQFDINLYLQTIGVSGGASVHNKTWGEAMNAGDNNYALAA
ncbi:hypothetical protein [Mucilaginibacter sp. UR6-11]|uniref:hypothetical protein n=1 Tax=Mucilaginibacter sp. UR6-11 TaxID=1435644 RepID=UPI001E4DC75D|nr:hypothetical protein [Mucilaginibacter sp. UR6-11]MCC8426951.1 hypothetical protein [Mucilaginibacter sp. UR6-11]